MRTLLLFLLTVSIARAQDSTLSYPHRYVLKLDLGALIDLHRTIQMGLEFPIGTQRSWQTVVGYGGAGMMGGDLGKKDAAEVWRIRNEIRFYTGRYRANRQAAIVIKSLPPLGNYWAVELLTKQINSRDQREFRTGGTNDAPVYKQESLLSQRYVLGVHLKVGRQFAFPKADKSPDRMLLDLYAGGGFRYAVIPKPAILNQYSEFVFGAHDLFIPGRHLSPSLVAGLKLGFAL